VRGAHGRRHADRPSSRCKGPSGSRPSP
jgi:hypothetical protein